MAKIRALNEESSSEESDDDTNKKISKEAQEELANLKYQQALKSLAQGNSERATEMLEELLNEPGLQLQNIQDDPKQCTPRQQKLQLGCVKLLGELYKVMKPSNLLRSKEMYEKAVYLDPEDKFHVWYRLAKVCLELGDLYAAHNAFAYTLHLRPSCWGCIENLVTISYAIHDYIGCLNYCAVGLKKDLSFIKGYVFRDLVYEIIPEIKDNLKTHIADFAVLSNSLEYQSHFKETYLAELKKVNQLAKDRMTTLEREADFATTPNVKLNLKSFNLVEIVKEFLAAYEEFLNSPEIHKDVELAWTLEDSLVLMEIDEFNKQPLENEESQMGEEFQSGISRSRSLSDDKDTPITTAAPSSDGTQHQEEEKKTVENNSESSQQLESQGQGGDGEPGNKKKGRGNVKWWQMEGKRRSQRVRGHLMPVSPDKAKKESCFVDQLKNLLPTPLLDDDGSACEREVISKSPEKNRWQKKHAVAYFGTKDEEAHARELLVKMRGRSLPGMIVTVTMFLTSTVKCPWSPELRELFLKLYQYYRSHVNFPCLDEFVGVEVIEDAITSLTFLEIVTEKYRTEMNSGDKFYQNLISKEVYFLEDLFASDCSIVPRELKLRSNWMSAKRLLDFAAVLNDTDSNVMATELLREMEADLQATPTMVWSVTETSNLICLESVTEKFVGITKMRNSQIVTDLYESHQYETLIEVLQSSINFSEIDKRDLVDIYFFAVALFRSDNHDCICQCVNLVNQAMKFLDNNVLSKALLLLDEIWEKMKTKFTVKDQKLVVSSLIKVLVSCEAKAPPNENICCIPWCILHGITYASEQNEPAFYLEEETVPNSILLLQMAHECMSRSEKCCIDNGRLMLYNMKAVLQVKKKEEYFAFDETRYCMEQAIFCLYSHPSKKSKAKNLKDHNSAGIVLTWEMCSNLYQYYYPDDFPEFDSYSCISAEVESLFQRILDIMPSEFTPTEKQKGVKSAIDTCKPVTDFETCKLFPAEIQDIYYLIGDHYFKRKEFVQAAKYLTWDLAVVPSRFDSWAGMGLSLGETINYMLNNSDVIDFKDLLKDAQSAAYCFKNALKFDPLNIKLRIEFGSFVYAMHAYCSRLLKLKTEDVDMELFQTIENAKKDFLKSATNSFEPVDTNEKTKSVDAEESLELGEEELWIHHYMLGKIHEKMLVRDKPQDFLKQYELAGRLLHDQGAPYPSKMNYYSPPELAIEALEVYYRIHASILSLVEHTEYSVATEKLYLEFIRRQENSPFIKCKQTKGDGGEGKRGRKSAEDTVSKKDIAEVTSVMNELLDKVENLVKMNIAQASSSGSGTSTTTTDEDSTSDSVKSGGGKINSNNPMSSFSLTEFRKRLKEKELREEKLASATEENKKIGDKSNPSSPPLEEIDLYEGLNLETNHFYENFKDLKFGAVIALCMKAMEESISRFPSHFKSYYRLANTYMVFLKDAKKAKEYLMGSPSLSQRKIIGLFGERKANNFFNGIWRNPIDDIARPGSFSYHMNKAMQLLLDVLSSLNDHQLLVEIVLNLSKVPDNEKKFLSNPDREMFCLQAQNSCVVSVKRKIADPEANYRDLGIEAYETYSKFQKLNLKLNPVMPMLHEIYKAHLRTQCNIIDAIPTPEQAVRYFAFHQLTLKSNRNAVNNAKCTSNQSSADSQKVSGDPVPKKRGRRAARLASQETTLTNQDVEICKDVSSIFQANNFIDTTSPINAALLAAYSPIPTMYPTMNIGAVQSAITPLLNDIDIIGATANNTPPPAHDFSRSTKKPIGSTQIITKAHSGPETAITEQPHFLTNVPKKISKDIKTKVQMPTLSASNKTDSSSTQVPGAASRKPADKYPPMPPLHAIRINTSPYKAQTTALEQPPSFQFSKQKNPSSGQSSQVEIAGKKNPPAAHAQAVSRKRKSQEGGEYVHVIDLTVKTPEKEKQPNMSQEPHLKTTEIVPAAIIPMGKIFPFCHSKPSTSISRESTPPQVEIRKMTPSYPLPPKKKHQMMYRSVSPQQQPPASGPPPSSDANDDVERSKF